MRINAQMAFSPRKREDIILRGFYNLRRPICEFLVFFFFFYRMIYRIVRNGTYSYLTDVS